jgi:hypothetical protein
VGEGALLIHHSFFLFRSFLFYFTAWSFFVFVFVFLGWRIHLYSYALSFEYSLRFFLFLFCSFVLVGVHIKFLRGYHIYTRSRLNFLLYYPGSSCNY